MAKIIIIGGGAAGMAAAVFLGEQNHQVHLFEKNEKLGKKLFITGKGHPNSNRKRKGTCPVQSASFRLYI